MKRALNRWDSAAIIIAIVVGVGIFRTPSEVARYLTTPWLILSAWIAGGAISLAGALSYAELSSTFPETGGNYVYLDRSYGKLTAFLFGWVELLVIRTGSIAAVAYILAEYLASFFSLDRVSVKWLAVFCVIFLGAVNASGLKQGKNTQNIFVVIKLGAILGMLVAGFAAGTGDPSRLRPAGNVFSGGSLTSFGLALIPVLWTFGGWHENVFMSGETRDASRSVPFALITGICVITLLYIAVNALYLYMFPVEIIQGSELIASRVFQSIHAGYGKKIFEGLVIVSSVSAINAMVMTGSRITYVMSRDNRFFSYMNRISGKTGVPSRAITVTCLWSCLLVLWGSFGKLLFFTGFLFWAFFALVVFGLFILRRKFPEIKRPYTVSGYPFTPAVFTLASASLSIVTFISYPVPSLAGLAILAGGIPVYYLNSRTA
jgi:amino acid transporter